MKREKCRHEWVLVSEWCALTSGWRDAGTILTPDKPCGWEAEFVARVTAPNCEGYRFVEIEHIEAAWPDEARWCAIQILRTAEKAEVTRG